jgi:glutamyl-tRNA synthetase
MSVRVRFAPSPTGQVHIGNIRAAIFNWLFARHHGGVFLLRVEDTDRERSTPEAVRAVLDAMAWLGLNVDAEPLYQSARREAHVAAANDLLARGLAYKEDKGGTGKGEAVLFRMPSEDVTFQDEIKGVLRKEAKDLKDFVIVRSDGSPVFHLGNVVDDIHMGITHVIRGDDHVENTYRHVALYRALGAPVPKFAHLPMIVNAQGKPYSKRDGAAFVGEFRDQGYLADALFNYLALLGWSPGDDREVLTREELVAAFGLDRVMSSPAQMDANKLKWMNGEHLRRLPLVERVAGCRADLAAHGLWQEGMDEDYLVRVVEAMAERLKFYTDMSAQAGFFFTEEYPFDEKIVQKRLRKPGIVDGLVALQAAWGVLASFTEPALEQTLQAVAAAQGANPADYIHATRAAVSGIGVGPGLYVMLVALGRERVQRRLTRAAARLSAG